MQRLFLTNDLAPEGMIELGRDHTHYLKNVLRMGEGGEVLVFNGHDGEWRAAIASVTKKTVHLKLVERVRVQSPESDLIYCFAPIKQGRLDYMVQKAVEMGAGLLQPVITQHTQVPKVGIERVQANVIEAAEQCGILAIPEVKPAMKLDRMLETWDSNRTLIFCDEGAAGDNPLGALMELQGRKLGLLVGPEGGVSQHEREVLRALPFVVPIPLGPRILRADTAAVAAFALIQAAAGDWHR